MCRQLFCLCRLGRSRLRLVQQRIVESPTTTNTALCLLPTLTAPEILPNQTKQRRSSRTHCQILSRLSLLGMEQAAALWPHRLQNRHGDAAAPTGELSFEVDWWLASPDTISAASPSPLFRHIVVCFLASALLAATGRTQLVASARQLSHFENAFRLIDFS